MRGRCVTAAVRAQGHPFVIFTLGGVLGVAASQGWVHL